MIKRFIIYGMIGVCSEIIWTGFGSMIQGILTLEGHSSIWMFPIYGMLVFLESVHDYIRNKPVIIRGGIYTILIFIGEYTSGSALRLFFGACPWDYYHLPYSIDGLITLIYCPVWFIFGLLFEILHDKMLEFGIGYKRRLFD